MRPASLPAAALILSGLIGCGAPQQPATPALPLSASGIPEVPDSLRRALARYQEWRPASLVDWGPDSGAVFIRRAGEIGQLFLSAGPGRAVKQLTFLPEPVIHASVCPDPGRKRLLFTQDLGGNEDFQIHCLDLASLKVTRLTRDSAQNDNILWSNKGDRFAYASNRRNDRDFDLLLGDPDRPGADTLILARGGAWAAADWSPDDRLLLVSHYLSRTLSRLYILDLSDGRLEALADTAKAVSQELGAWGAGSRAVFFTSDEGTDFRCLRHLDLVTGRERLLTRDIPWDVREIALSPDRSLLAFTTNEHGFSRLYLLDARTFARRKAAGLPEGIIGPLKFDRKGLKLAMNVETAKQPGEIYTLDLADLSVKPWNAAGAGALDPGAFILPSVFHYPSFDSVGGGPRPIPCLAYKPRKGTSPYPALILIHGGPESQFWPSFKPELQFYLDEFGIAILAPNVRGSGGYGKAWLSLDDGVKREESVQDIGALLDWIAEQPDLDSSRVAVMGGSYGGYMALASLVHYRDRLRAGVDFYGISDFVTFLEHTSAYRRDLRRVEYGDERNPAMRAFLARISPVARAREIDRPLLIVQGANDARVPLEESERIAAAVRKNGAPVWFVTFGDEGHGFRRKSNKDYQECVTAMFLKNFLVEKRQ